MHNNHTVPQFPEEQAEILQESIETIVPLELEEVNNTEEENEVEAEAEGVFCENAANSCAEC